MPRWWAWPGLPVQALGGGPVESGASQQSHCLLSVQRVQTTGPGVKGHRLSCLRFAPLYLSPPPIAPPPYLYNGGWLGDRDLILAMSERELWLDITWSGTERVEL